LKSNINTYSATKVQRRDNANIAENGEDHILELYRLAALIYLERQSTNFSGQSAEIELWTDKGILILSQLSGIDQPFPLFVLGCEARTDEQRDIILDLILRTGFGKRSRNLQQVSNIIKSIWVQDDLADHTLDYRDKLESIFYSTNVIPSFA
jgi:hypothetical protein